MIHTTHLNAHITCMHSVKIRPAMHRQKLEILGLPTLDNLISIIHIKINTSHYYFFLMWRVVESNG